MKDNSTGKNKDFYDLGKRMFDRIKPLYKNSKRITENELHDLPIQQHRPRQKPPGRETAMPIDTP